MRPEDLSRLRVPSWPTLSPDGGLVCYAVSRMDLAADAYRSDLWIAATDGSSPPRRLTFGPRDLQPAFSPCGRWLAFLRATDDDPPQLHLLPTAGGEPRRVCEHPLGVTDPAWSPDSARIAYVARVPEEGRYGTDPDVPPAKEPARRITTRRYRLDGVGWTIDRRAHVFVVDPHDPDAVATQLTRGDFDHAEPAWSPDGERIAFVSARHPERDMDLVAEVYAVAADGGDAEQLTSCGMAAAAPAFTPDGGDLVFTGAGHPLDVVGRNTGLWRVPAGGSGEAVRLTDVEAHDVANPFASGATPLLVDEASVTTVRLWRGAVQLCAFPLGGGEPQVLVDGPCQVQGYARTGGVTAAVISHATSAGDLFVWDGDPTKRRQLTDLGGTFARDVSLRPMVEVETSADDGYPVHGWVVKPAGAGPFPVLLNIHGGPFTQYGWTLFDEAQTYAGAGYAVVMGNPRGSQGYGEKHGRAVVHAMGDRDHADLEALLDAALADPDLDPTRVGIMGGSYGGFMTTLMIARSERFAAAISERALNAFDSFTGSSDIGSFFTGLYAGDDPEQIAAQSPFSYADDIKTPTLIIHSEEDWRCPLEQAQRLFERLKRNNVETEMLVFPGEGHELSRSGLPSHRVQRFEAILEWWSRHLGGGTAEASAEAQSEAS